MGRIGSRIGAVLVAGACGGVLGCSFQPGALGDAPPRQDAGDDATRAGDAADAATQPACVATYPDVFGNSRYRKGTGTWFAAQEMCEAEGAHLVVIDSALENAFVLELHPTGDIHIGLSDHLDEGTFRWVTGPLVSAGFRNWQSNQPNNAGGAEDCGEMNLGGGWNDIGCGVAQTFICECDLLPPPQSPTWCRTGQDTSCGECDEDCTMDGERCTSSHECD